MNAASGGFWFSLGIKVLLCAYFGGFARLPVVSFGYEFRVKTGCQAELAPLGECADVFLGSRLRSACVSVGPIWF